MLKVREVKIVKEIMACNVSPVAMFSKRMGLKVIKYDILVCHSCHMMFIISSYDDHHVII